MTGERLKVIVPVAEELLFDEPSDRIAQAIQEAAEACFLEQNPAGFTDVRCKILEDATVNGMVLAERGLVAIRVTAAPLRPQLHMT